MAEFYYYMIIARKIFHHFFFGGGADREGAKRVTGKLVRLMLTPFCPRFRSSFACLHVKTGERAAL